MKTKETKKNNGKNVVSNEKEERKQFNQDTAKIKKATKSFAFIVKSASKSVTKEWLDAQYSKNSGHFRNEMLKVCANKKLLFEIFEKFQEKVNGVFISTKEVKADYVMSDAIKARWLQEVPMTYHAKGFAPAVNVTQANMHVGIINIIKKDGPRSFYVFRKENFAVSDVIEAAKQYVLAGCPDLSNIK